MIPDLPTVDAAQTLQVGPAELVQIVLRTLWVSGAATLLSLGIGVPLGYLLARRRFRGRTVLLGFVNTGMGLPPVLVGLLVWLLLIRSGPLGGLELIYSTRAMVIAQLIISTPMVVAFSSASIQALPAHLPDLLTTLGAGPWRRLALLAREARLGLLAAVMAGFGAAISEIGASLQVGGNLRWQTRILTTAVVTETGRGQVASAIRLGLILLVLTFAVNVALTWIQQARGRS